MGLITRRAYHCPLAGFFVYRHLAIGCDYLIDIDYVIILVVTLGIVDFTSN